MSARAKVERVRTALTALILTRALCYAVGAGLSSWTVALLTQAWWSRTATPAVPIVVALTAAAAAAWWAVRRSGGWRLSAERVALWLEERDPTLQWLLVTAIEDAGTSRRLVESLGDRDFRLPLRAAAGRSMRWPLAALAAGALTVAVGRTVVPNVRQAAQARAPVGRTDAGGTLDLVVRLSPPSYAHLAEARLHNPSVVRGLAGSVVRVESPTGDSLRAAPDTGLTRLPGPAGSLVFRLEGRPMAVRLEGGRGRSRLLTLEPVLDSAPGVSLRLPARDSVLRDSTGLVRLAAEVRDDLGARRASFEYIVSSGEGETFAFASGTLGTRALGGSRRDTLGARLDLAALRLKPGDIVHLRAVAWDARDDTAAARGVSETRTLRIARSGEYDSVAVEAAGPADADKSLLSQRMLINLAEALVRQRRALSRTTFSDESRRIGLDQGRLRKQVAELVFARLGDDPSGEHFHGDGHEHAGQELRPALTPDELLKAAENATRGGVGELLDFHDETPVVAINRPLLEAYNAMWDAGRELEQISPERALPHMYRALDGIQRARNAERLYLRSRPPRAVVDVDRVRLQGKDRGTPGARSAREPATGARRAAATRFAGHVALAATAPAAAADSLLLLRLAVLGFDEAAAAALANAADALRTGGDATPALVRARLALEGAAAARDSLPRWSRAP